jgi:hypothetical protein
MPSEVAECQEIGALTYWYRRHILPDREFSVSRLKIKSRSRLMRSLTAQVFNDRLVGVQSIQLLQ